ncbi:MAG TPA: hypothetical protein H9853_04370 [Candidatus Sphingobacterium stercoripullorum]|uniref:DUF4294 domain-containing protein n=1 Tax=Candidatus Sphingobacterium stercoripullorum TaxID=2838759 RepID=A0A9D1W8D5_9SPHI|nr:hypothetical protein [Candidatus Sphingobacterium stercoripullorum]
MKTIVYTFLLLIAIATSVCAQETGIHTKPTETEIKDQIRKWNKFQYAYLFTLTDEQRKELFYHRRKGENVTHKMREADVKYDEERFQRVKETYDNMTDAQRDSLIRANYYRDDMTFEIKLVPLEESLFRESALKDMQDVFEAFKGLPVYQVIREQKNKDGEVVVRTENFLFYKTLYGFRTTGLNTIRENFQFQESEKTKK